MIGPLYVATARWQKLYNTRVLTLQDRCRSKVSFGWIQQNMPLQSSPRQHHCYRAVAVSQIIEQFSRHAMSGALLRDTLLSTWRCSAWDSMMGSRHPQHIRYAPSEVPHKQVTDKHVCARAASLCRGSCTLRNVFLSDGARMEVPYIAASSMAEQVKASLGWLTRVGLALTTRTRGGVGALPTVLSLALLIAVRNASPGFLVSTC